LLKLALTKEGIGTLTLSVFKILPKIKIPIVMKQLGLVNYRTVSAGPANKKIVRYRITKTLRLTSRPKFTVPPVPLYMATLITFCCET
jgi:hypothetical protein